MFISLLCHLVIQYIKAVQAAPAIRKYATKMILSFVALTSSYSPSTLWTFCTDGNVRECNNIFMTLNLPSYSNEATQTRQILYRSFNCLFLFFI